MSVFPASPLGIKVEVLLNATWTDISTYVYQRDTMSISGQGRANEQAQLQPVGLTLTLNNSDGRFTPRNSAGAYYPYVQQNTQIRVSVTSTSVTAVTYSGFRFWGEVSEWPQNWDSTHRDIYVTLQASGVWRRISADAVSVGSPYTRYVKGTIRSAMTIAGYWPMEDASGAASLAPGIPLADMTIVNGSPVLASNSSFPGSNALVQLNKSELSGLISTSASPTVNEFFFAMMVPSGGDTGVAATALARMHTSGTVASVDVIPGANGTGPLVIKGFNGSGTQLFSGSVTLSTFGVAWLVQVALTQSGSNVIWTLNVIAPGGTSLAGTATGTVAGTVSDATSVIFNPGSTWSGTAVGQALVVYGNPSAVNLANALGGFKSETAVARFQRLCTEFGIGSEVIGAGTGITMGPQNDGTLSSLFQSIEDTDGGMLFESADQLGMGYRPLATMQNQTVQATVNYATAQLAVPLATTHDDALFRNEVTLTNWDGYAWTAFLSTGNISINPPPSGVGDYPYSRNVNAANDSDLAGVALQVLKSGTVDQNRFPVVTIDLARSAAASLFSVVPSLRPGDYVQVTNMPSDLPATAKQLFTGWTETLSAFTWTIAFNAIPESPFETVFNPGTVVAGHTASPGVTPIEASKRPPAKILPGSITGSEIATGTITGGSGGNIAGQTITGGGTSGNIAPGTVTGGSGGEIASATVTGTNVAVQTLTGGGAAGNIAALTITATEITAATITGAKLANATITATQIANATITSTQISGTAGITGTQIASATIAAANIVSGTITSTQISGTAGITGTQIANATITSTQISGTANITGSQIANATITSAQISASANITGSQIANATITTTQISATAGITGGQIASATISGTNIASLTINATNIANLTITAAQIANLTITGGPSGKIAANTITGGSSGNLVLNTITAANILAGTITATEIAANTITAAKIAAGTITTAEIAAGTITSANIAAGAITAGLISAGAIDGQTISGVTITGATIQATGPGVLVYSAASGTVLNLNPNFTSGITNWTAVNGAVSYAAPTFGGHNTLLVSITTLLAGLLSGSASSEQETVTAGSNYQVAGMFQTNASTGATNGNLVVQWYNSGGANFATTGVSNFSGSSFTTWTSFSGVVTAPVGAVKMALNVTARNGASGGTVSIGQFSITSNPQLVASTAPTAGTDSYGFAYKAGVWAYSTGGGASGLQPNGNSVSLILSPSGSTPPGVSGSAVGYGTGSGGMNVIDGGDGQAYSVGQRVKTLGTGTISTTATVLTSTTLAVRTYRVTGRIFFSVTTAGTFSFEVAGPGSGFTTNMDITVKRGAASTLFGASYFTSVNALSVITGSLAINSGYTCEIDGTIAVTTGGTFNIDAACSGAASLLGGYVEFTPV